MGAGRGGSYGRDRGGEQGGGPRAAAPWRYRYPRAGAAVALLLAAVLVAASGCFGYTITKETEQGTTSGDSGAGASGLAADGSDPPPATGGTSAGGVVSTGPAGPDARLDRAEIERRLGLAPFAYVAETDIRADASGAAAAAAYTAAFAMVDSVRDVLAARPECQSQPVDVAVAPDGRLVYVTDWARPVIHVLDAESMAHLRDIDLPGVRPPDIAAIQSYATNMNAPAPWDWGAGCGGGIAVTPDGAFLLVTTHSGLMVVALPGETVVRTFPDLHASAVAVSFDGERAYLGIDDWATREPRTLLEWTTLRNEGVGGGLAVLDLRAWEVVRERQFGFVNAIAMKPDGSEVYVSDHGRKALRMLDAFTLEDRGLIPLGRSFPVGVGVLPDGSKAYVVCTADSTDLYAAAAGRGTIEPPSAEDYFCAVVDVGAEEVVKRIPLQTY